MCDHDTCEMIANRVHFCDACLEEAVTRGEARIINVPMNNITEEQLVQMLLDMPVGETLLFPNPNPIPYIPIQDDNTNNN